MLKKVGKYYWLDIRIDGKRIRRSLRTDNKTVALHRIGELEERIKAGSTKGRITLDDFCKKYIDFAWIEKPKSAKREEQRLAKIKAFWKNQFQITTLAEITPYHIEQLKAHLGTFPGTKGRNLAKSTINRYMKIISRMFNLAIAWELYDGKNPIKSVRFYQEKSPIQPLSDNQAKKILESAEKMSRWPKSATQREFYDICMIGLHTGMRKSEILNMRWSDTKNNMLHVMGKGEKERDVPINETVRQLLEKKPRRYKHVIDIPNRESQDAIRKSVERVRKEVGFYWTFHQLRHYFATKMLEKGVDLVTIARILGHSKPSISLDMYGHTSREKLLKAVELLD